MHVRYTINPGIIHQFQHWRLHHQATAAGTTLPCNYKGSYGVKCQVLYMFYLLYCRLTIAKDYMLIDSSHLCPATHICYLKIIIHNCNNYQQYSDFIIFPRTVT